MTLSWKKWKVLHLLHWPPKPPSSKPPLQYTQLLDNQQSPSLWLVRTLFPDIRGHFLMDLYCRAVDLRDSTGRQRTNKELYENDPHLSL